MGSAFGRQFLQGTKGSPEGDWPGVRRGPKMKGMDSMTPITLKRTAWRLSRFARVVRPWMLAAAMMVPAVPGNAGPLELARTPGWAADGDPNTQVLHLETSPDSERVYAAGASAYHAWIAAHEAATGAEVWSFTSRHTSSVNALGVSPMGNRIAIAGWMSPTSSERDSQMSIWMLRSNGANLWSARFTGNGANRGDSIADVAFSPDGNTVYVTGLTWFEGRRRDLVVAAYNSGNGRLRWRKVIDTGRTEGSSGSRGISEEGRAIAVARNGKIVVVTGYNARPAAGSNERSQAFTRAFKATDGSTLWNKNSTVTGDPNKTPTGEDVAIVGSAVYVGGSNWDNSRHESFVSKHALGSGSRRWSMLHDSSETMYTGARSIAADDRAVYLAGPATTTNTSNVFYVWAQRAGDGSTAWSTDTSIRGQATSVALDPTGLLYAVGTRTDNQGGTRLCLLAIDPADGTTQWVGVRDPLETTPYEAGNAISVSADGARVFAAGSFYDWDAGAYRGTILAFDI